MSRRLATFSVFAAASLALAACGGGGGESDGAAKTEAAATPAAEAPAPAASAPTAAPTSDPASATPAAPAAGDATLQTAALVGDAARGQAVFAQCRSCHVVEPGVNRVGPSLHGVVGKTAGQVAGYKYSEANAKSGVVWTEANLNAYLENPRKFMPGTKMSYAGLRDPQKRADLIAWLKTQG